MSAPVSSSTLTTFTAADGDNLAVQDWPVPDGVALRGVVVLVHGLGEHAGRHDRLARRLNAWGFAVRGYDQYGHGESGGVRGGLPAPMRLVDDLGDMVDSVRARTPAGVPVLLLGHSLGGLVAACYAVAHPDRVQALVLSSPALATRLSGFQKLLLGTLPHLAPNLRVSNGLDPHWLSHDAAVVAAYRADPLVHDRISAGLALFIAESGPRVVAHAPRWPLPTLVLYAGQDRAVDPAGSQAFLAQAPAALVTGHCFAGLRHEVFNEADPEPALAHLQRWLDARF